MGGLEATHEQQSAYLLGGARRIHPTLEKGSAVAEQAQGRSFMVSLNEPEGKGKRVFAAEASWWTYFLVKVHSVQKKSKKDAMVVVMFLFRKVGGS